MQLVVPDLAWKESFAEALQEFDEASINGFWNYRTPITSISEYIERTQAFFRGEGLSTSMVPSSTFWLIDQESFIGHVNIRHNLTPRLSLLGGHIGYAVRPSMQGKGYGSSLLSLALPKAKALGITNVLITCDIDNQASRKIIEKNGGKLLDAVVVEDRPVYRFRIAL